MLSTAVKPAKLCVKQTEPLGCKDSHYKRALMGTPNTEPQEHIGDNIGQGP